MLILSLSKYFWVLFLQNPRKNEKERRAHIYDLPANVHTSDTALPLVIFEYFAT